MDERKLNVTYAPGTPRCVTCGRPADGLGAIDYHDKRYCFRCYQTERDNERVRAVAVRADEARNG